MKTAKDWFDDYAISHQHPTNQLVHYICVPLIFFSVIGLLMSIPSEPLENIFGLYNPLIENWAMVVTFFISIFYLRMVFLYFLQILFFILLAIGGNFWLGNNVNLLLASAIIFIAAWVGQFWGHQIEGQKPSFLKDLQFLLIGPLWVVKKLS